jgi:hypothetical protein
LAVGWWVTRSHSLARTPKSGGFSSRKLPALWGELLLLKAHFVCALAL